MVNNKKIIQLCPNFYKIIDFNPIVGDDFSHKIVDIYHEFVFKVDINNEEQVNVMKELDCAVFKYINDFAFRKEVQKLIKKGDINDIAFIIDTIINLYVNYEDYTTRVIYISRWI